MYLFLENTEVQYTVSTYLDFEAPPHQLAILEPAFADEFVELNSGVEYAEISIRVSFLSYHEIRNSIFASNH